MDYKYQMIITWSEMDGGVYRRRPGASRLYGRWENHSGGCGKCKSNYRGVDRVRQRRWNPDPRTQKRKNCMICIFRAGCAGPFKVVRD